MFSLNSRKISNTVNETDIICCNYFYFPIKIIIIFYFCQVLSHSWEWIRRNKNTGLMALSEEALESKQKSARNIRKFRCYQGDVLKNLSQAHRTMQLVRYVFK